MCSNGLDEASLKPLTPNQLDQGKTEETVNGTNGDADENDNEEVIENGHPFSGSSSGSNSRPNSH